jgi:hypothetical protein
VTDLPKPNIRIRRYLIEVKDPLGRSVFPTGAYWDKQDKRVVIAQTKPGDRAVSVLR